MIQTDKHCWWRGRPCERQAYCDVAGECLVWRSGRDDNEPHGLMPGAPKDFVVNQEDE